jgi:hypothetical protein
MIAIGMATTCMNATSFQIAFPDAKPRKIINLQECISASGDRMSSLGIYKIDLYINVKSLPNK